MPSLLYRSPRDVSLPGSCPSPLLSPSLGCHLHSGGGAGRASGIGGTAVSMAVTEAAPLQTQLGNSIVGAGRVIAPLGYRGQPGEVDSQVCDLPQL